MSRWLSTTLTASLLLAFPLASSAGSPGDLDGDGVADSLDNCALIPNAGPTANCDTDNDGYGNLCDGDFDNNQSTTTGDIALFWIPDFYAGNDTFNRGTDMDCNGSITSGDVAFFWISLFTTGTLGPSGLACAGTVPCPTP